MSLNTEIQYEGNFEMAEEGTHSTDSYRPRSYFAHKLDSIRLDKFYKVLCYYRFLSEL